MPPKALGVAVKRGLPASERISDGTMRHPLNQGQVHGIQRIYQRKMRSVQLLEG